jgi:hypothetical protein
MKKLWAVYSLLTMGFVTGALWLSQGCAGKLPALPTVVATFTPIGPSNLISTFESGAYVNPSLDGVLDPLWNPATPSVAQPGPGEDSLGRGLGFWSVDTFGGNPSNTINDGQPKDCNDILDPCFIKAIPATMAAGNPSAFAGHVWGYLNTTASSYEAHQFRCRFRSSATNPYYDISRFSGIQFDIFIGNAVTMWSPPVTLVNSNVPSVVVSAGPVTAINYPATVINGAVTTIYSDSVTTVYPGPVTTMNSCPVTYAVDFPITFTCGIPATIIKSDPATFMYGTGMTIVNPGPVTGFFNSPVTINYSGPASVIYFRPVNIINPGPVTCPTGSVSASGPASIIQGDNNLSPVFQIAIDKTLPASSGAGGTCSGSGCYNHYQYPLSNLSSAQCTPLGTCGLCNCRNAWVRVRLPWSAFIVPFGTIPGTMIDNIKKTIFIQWQFTDNLATAGRVSHTDFWVDNVEFIP